MKLPGMGEVKNKNVAIGAGVVGVIVLLAYFRKKRAVPAPSGDGTIDPNAIDPTTGIPYGEETGSGGGYYTNSSVPNPYVNQTSTTSTTGKTYTDNLSWLYDAEQAAVNQFNVNYALASSALGKYIAQTPSGLNPDEYLAVSEVVGLLGPPPTGTHRLIQAAPTQTPSAGNPPPTKPPEPDEHPKPVNTPAPMFSAEWARQHQAIRGDVYGSDQVNQINSSGNWGNSIVGQYVGDHRIDNSGRVNYWDGNAWWVLNIQ
jgi:hypothetical protein